MRAVVRRVHPDLFAAHPFERAKNTESLKVRADENVIDLACVFGSLGGQCLKQKCIYIACKGWLRTSFHKQLNAYMCAV